MSEHTPAPWTWRKFSAPCYQCLEANGKDIITADTDCGLPYIDITEANAKLIEVTPDLLKALQNIIDAMPEMVWSGKDEGKTRVSVMRETDYHKLMLAKTEAQEVIAKVTG